jgi:CBS domain-containing protein
VNVENLMNVPAITCNPDTSLEEVASLMCKNDIGFLPVVAKDTGRLVGIITERDAVIAAFTRGKRLSEIAADVSMTRSVKTCRVGMQVEDAEQIMEMNQIHRLPVVDREGRLVGVISLNDIARHAASDEIEILEQEVAVALAKICHPRTNRLLH